MSGSWTDPEDSPAPTQEFHAVGRHAASQSPTTGPLHRIGFPPGGRHQEADLEPKSWPWLIAMAVALAGGILVGIVLGQRMAGPSDMERLAAEVTPRAPIPEETVTVLATKTTRGEPLPGRTVTTKPSPRPTATKTVTTPVPGPTVYRTASPAPRPTVTKFVEEVVCYQFRPRTETLEEMVCP